MCLAEMAGSKGMLPVTGDLGTTSSLYYFEYILRMGRANLCGRHHLGT